MRARRVISAILVSLLTFVVYMVCSGTASLYDVVTGLVVALCIGAIFSGITIERPAKVINPARWLALLLYAAKYFIIYETSAHLDVIKRILHPKMPVNPAIVKAPFHTETDYGITAVANSITNTPGTVVVEVDKDSKVFYIHWIDAKTLDPFAVRKHVFEDFERYVKKIFD